MKWVDRLKEWVPTTRGYVQRVKGEVMGILDDKLGELEIAISAEISDIAAALQELRDQIGSGTPSPEQLARFDELIGRVRNMRESA